MKDPTHRYDAWGNPILPHAQMLIYYRDNPEALEIIKNNMPHRFVVIPNVDIQIQTGISPIVVIYLTYPGGDRHIVIDPSVRSWEALRRTWHGKKGWKHFYTGKGIVTLRREGTVILDTARKFGLWS